MNNAYESIKNKLDSIISLNRECIDINWLIDYISSSNLILEEKNNLIKKAYSYNVSKTKELNDEINYLKEIENNNDLEIANIKLQTKSEIKNNDLVTTNKTFHSNNINDYIELINKFEDAIDFEILTDLIEEDKFSSIIFKLILHFTLEKITLKKLQEEENTSFFKEEELKYNNTVKYLKELIDSRQQDNLNLNNKVIYSFTAASNVNFINSLEKIPTEYYTSIKNAFLSIFDGTFKNNKRIGKNDDGFYSPLLQVRDNDIRIYYLKISANLYLIIDVIVKKVSTSKNYSNYVRRISKDAYNNREQFLNLNEKEKEQFINKNIEITDQINELLNQKKKVLR